MAENLDSIVDGEPEKLASGFEFTEGPLWHPEGFFYFVDLRVQPARLYSIVPGQKPEVVWDGTNGCNGATFDLNGNLLLCQSGDRRIIRRYADGRVEPAAESVDGKRLNRPNDIVCKSDGSIYFTDPAFRMPFPERELPSAVNRIAPDGTVSTVAECESPNGLAFSPDESILYVANTRIPYLHALEMNPDGTVRRRRIFADMASDEGEGVPDGMKVDVEGNVYCTGAGGTWVFSPGGQRLGVIKTPEVPANLAFGGPDRRTLFFTARTSVYSLRVKIPGQP